jgi:hypothetical protein
VIEEDGVGTHSAEVEQFLADLQHLLKAGVLQLRAAILPSDLAITEHVKWNASSFCYDGPDRVTFRLQPRGRLQLTFHQGAKGPRGHGRLRLRGSLRADDVAGTRSRRH